MSGSADQRNQGQTGAGGPASLGGSLMDVPKARLVCIESAQLDGALPNGGTITLAPGSEQIIGRDASCSFAVPSRKLSRQHARIFGGVGTWGVEDLNSTNGVLVNKQRVTTAWLKQGDEIRLGPVAFRYELEAAAPPDGATMTMTTAMTQQARPQQQPDDGGGERTMMIGSLSASKAVIDAARKSEPKQAPAAAAPPVRPKAEPAGKTPREPMNVKKLAVFGVLTLILAGVGGAGAVYWPKYQKQQRMEEVAQAGARVVRVVVARVRDYTGPNAGEGRYDEDVAAIRPALERTWEVLASYPEEAALTEIYARLRFLSFERSFAAAFGKDDFAEAARIAQDAQGRLMGLERDLPPTTEAAQKKDLNAAIELLEFANLLTQLREFARKHPQVSATAPNLPTKTEMAAFDEKRDQFIKLRRAHNKVLSIDYLLFNKIVQEVENRDLALINHWREFLTARGG